MSEVVEQGQAAPQAGTEAAKPAAKKTEYTDVTLEDGRQVKFAGKRQMNKTVEVGEDGVVKVTFDFVNGKTLSILSTDLNDGTKARALGHGISQKVGDESSGVAKVDDMVLATEAMIGRLKKGDWEVARQAGDSFAGGSLVIKAISEATNKPADWVKEFLQKKLDAAKEKGEKLSRADLYASFRNPNSKTGQIIERLEKEERAKATKVNADDLLAEAEAAQ